MPTEAEPRPREFFARMDRRGRARSFAARSRRFHAGRRLALLAAAVAVPAVAQGDFGSAGWMAAATQQTDSQVVPMGYEKPGESFPGSAFYYLDDLPTVAALSPRSIDAQPFSEGSIQGLPGALDRVIDPGPAARALRLAGSMTDRSRAQYCLTMAIYYEAASEPDAGQRAVAQVVINRVAHPTYPATVCGVVFQGSERSTGCQFSFTCDGSLARKPARMWWDRAARVARQALAGVVYQPAGLATHYHTVQVHPYWADSLAPVGTIGAHRFYRWRGAAGRPAAFANRYFGGEPLPVPHPRLASAALDTAEIIADPLALARSYEAGLAASATAPRNVPAPVYSAEVQARGGDALYRADHMPASGQVREEYANSGRWLSQP